MLHQRPTRAELLRERAAALYSGVRTCSAALMLLSSFLIGGHSGSRSRSTASGSAMVVRCSVGSFTSPPIGQLGNLFSADRRNKRALLSILSSVFPCLVSFLGARGLQWTVTTISLDRISSGKFKKISRFAAFVPVEG